jgi:hypothetical protein
VILLALDAEGIAGDIGDFGKVEIDHLAAAPVAPVIDRRLQPAIEQHRRDADAVEHFQRGRVEGGGAQILRAIPTGFKDDDILPRLGQQRRQHRAHRPGSDDGDLAPFNPCHSE